MSNPGEENAPNLDDVIERHDDALPKRSRYSHGKTPGHLDDDALAEATEQERVDAGLADYAPSEVPPATDPLPSEASEEADLAQRGLTEEEGEE